MKKQLCFLLSVLMMTFSAQAGDMMVRLRAINIMPDEDGTPSTVGGRVQLNSESVPEIDFTYFVTDSIAFELIAATATHTVTTYNSGGSNLNLGEISLLPPTLLAQYHMTIGKLKPYVGVGLNYTFFYGGSPGAYKGVDYDNSFGWAAQVGADLDIGNNMYLNFDLKRIAIASDVRVELYDGTVVTADVDINPYVAGLWVGWRF